MERRALGFDVRWRHEDFVAAEWSTERRQRFLLRPSVRLPSSVDRMVWPSVFEFTSTAEASVAGGAPSFRLPDPAEQVRFETLRLWLSETEMQRAFLAGRRVNHSLGVPVALFLLRHGSPVPDEFWDAVLCPPIEGPAVASDWPLLGYDVADREGISGLSNCGYDDEERAALQEQWESKINRYGLFDRPDDAFLFKDVTDRRVAEHSPFFVYGLHQSAETWQRR